MVIIGVDGEMSGTDLSKGHRLIQIGFSVIKEDKIEMFYRDLNPGELVWNEDSAKVHEIPLEFVKLSPSSEKVDEECYQWLTKNGVNSANVEYNIPVGFNVGTFDMPFIKHSLPKTYSLFSRRTIDINSICYALDGKDGLDYRAFKKLAKEYAIKKIGGIGLKEHNAGYDSLLHLYAFKYLKWIAMGIFEEIEKGGNENAI